MTSLNTTPIFRPFPIKITQYTLVPKELSFFPFSIFNSPNNFTFTSTVITRIPSPIKPSSLSNDTPSSSIISEDNSKLLRKTFRKKTFKVIPPSSNKIHKRLKKLDKSTIEISLDQLQVKNTKLNSFPLVKCNLQSLKLSILNRMLLNENYFTINNDMITSNNSFNNNNLYHLNENSEICSSVKNNIINNENYKCILNTYNNEHNINLNLKIGDVIRAIYNQIKETVNEIQKNFIGKKKEILNITLINKLYYLITLCNEISSEQSHYTNPTNNECSFLTSETKDSSACELNESNVQIKKCILFKCSFCNKVFPNGQGLGGHISRLHPNQSEKYKIKQEIRNKRTDRRNEIYKIKVTLFKKYSLDYDELVKNKCGKNVITEFLKEHKGEYNIMKKQTRKLITSHKVNFSVI